MLSWFTAVSRAWLSLCFTIWGFKQPDAEIICLADYKRRTYR